MARASSAAILRAVAISCSWTSGDTPNCVRCECGKQEEVYEVGMPPHRDAVELQRIACRVDHAVDGIGHIVATGLLQRHGDSLLHYIFGVTALAVGAIIMFGVDVDVFRHWGGGVGKAAGESTTRTEVLGFHARQLQQAGVQFLGSAGNSGRCL